MGRKEDIENFNKEKNETIDNIVFEITEDTFLDKFIPKEQASALREALVKAEHEYVLETHRKYNFPLSSAKKQKKDLVDLDNSLSNFQKLLEDFDSNTWALIFDAASEDGKDGELIESWIQNTQEMNSIISRVAKNYRGISGKPINKALYVFTNILLDFWCTDPDRPLTTGWTMKGVEDGQPSPKSPADQFISIAAQLIDSEEYPHLPNVMRVTVDLLKAQRKLKNSPKALPENPSKTS